MKMRNLAGAVAALACIAFGGKASAGNVWEFISDSKVNASYSSGDEIYFRMRLLAPNITKDFTPPAEDRLTWGKAPVLTNATVATYIALAGYDYDLAMANLNADFPLQIGVVANGRTLGATFVESMPTNDNAGTDFVFRFPVKCGDYALPLRLAADANGTPVNSGKWSEDAPETSTRYFFFNGPGDANDIWQITTSEKTVFVPQMVDQEVAQKDAVLPHVNPPLADGDYLRAYFNYTLETLELDDESAEGDDGRDYWRVIRGSASQPSEPRMRTVDGLNPTENGIHVYVWVAPGPRDGDGDDPATWSGWSENGYAVTIAPDGGRHVSVERFQDPDGVERDHNVYEFTLSPGTQNYTFPLKGQVVGGTARIVLSSYRHWNKIGSTGDFVADDFRKRTVYCGEQKPTLSVTLDNYSGTAIFPDASHELLDYTKAERLRVRLEGVDAHPEMKARLGFRLKDSTAFPTNIISVSTDREAGFLVEKLLSGMEVTFKADSNEAEESKEGLYLFILGGTKETSVSPGITITPSLSDASVSVQKTNELHVVIKGMQPEITKPVGTAEKPAQPDILIYGGGQKEVSVTLVDSYRNLHLSPAEASNGCYRVFWNTGTPLGTEIITNDVNGLPLVPDSYGQLNFTVTYPRQDATNLASFYVINPEDQRSRWFDDAGREQADSFVRVIVTRPPSVTATAKYQGKAGDTFDEGLTIDFDFELDQLDYLSRDLYAFLQPCNEAASNRCEATFITETKDGVRGTTGVSIWGKKGSTDDATGGLKLLDGPGNPQPKFRVVLCTSATYDPAKVVGDFVSQEFPIKVMNVAPVATQFKMEGSSRYIRMSGATTDVVRVNVSREFTPKAIEDVVADLDAEANRQIVLRWCLYEIEDGDENVEPNEVIYTVGKDTPYTMPGLMTGMKKIVVQAQDKDMRPKGELVEDAEAPGGWKYVMDKDDPEHDWWEDDENGWGPKFVIYVPVSDKPAVNVIAVGGLETLGGLQVFSEYQLPPFRTITDPNMGFLVTLSEGYKDSALRVRLELQYQGKAPAERVDDFTWAVSNGYVTVGVTNLVFNKNSTTSGSKVRNVAITDFDGTWRDDLKRQGYAIWRVIATVYDPAGAMEENPVGYIHGACDFYVRNEAPTLTSDLENTDPATAIEVAKNGTVTIPYALDDIEADLTNGMKVVCSVKGGEVVGEATHLATGGVSVATGEFTVRLTAVGTNAVTVTATDKDFGSSSMKFYYAVEKTNDLFLYPAKPTSPSTDSDDIADYFSASGIGYGRVWANNQLHGIQYWIQTWTSPGSSESVLAYAMGYRAGEQEMRNDVNYPAFVDSNGGDTGNTGYRTPLKDIDSFFYRWFAKITSANTSENSSWTPYRPVPQLSYDRNAVARATVISIAFPKQTGVQTVYSDISALAIFSREFIWSDNMGDINGDGVPDSYVMKYNLVTDYTGGNDLKDVNFETDGKKPYCQDYLPMTEIIAYSKLIPALTAYDNIKNAQAFTPRLKIRGYDDNLNDATAEFLPNNDGTKTRNQAFVDDAKPEKRYEMEDGSWSAASCTVSYVEHLAWKAYKAVHTNATFDSWSPERPTDPTKADTDNDGVNDGLEYYWWYRAHVGWLENGVLRKASGRRYDPRNPGEGTVIPAEEIERIFDPILPLADKTQDTDNDGLPDLIEFEIGTNPFDFDSDGDGLPDGFELMIAGTDPTTAYTTVGICDAMRNFDGDAMAFTTPQLEKDGHVQPVPLHTDVPFVFALVDADGDSDGVQWYVAEEAPTNFATLTSCATGTSFKVDGTTYVSSVPVPVVDGRLAIDLPKATTWSTAATNAVPVPVDTNVTLIALMPTRIPAGVKVTGLSEGAAYATLCFDSVVTNVNAAWIYGSRLIPTQTTGNERANAGGYGMLAVGRYQDAPKEMQIAALPAEDETVAYLHYLVYQKFGFDPRTAWNANTPLAARWGETVGEGEDSETVSDTVSRKSSYAGIATRTREYTTYDEFLVYSFFVNNGMKDLYVEDLGDRAPLLAEIWYANTTNPQGPHEPDIDYSTKVTAQEGGETAKATAEYFGRKSDNGADTDGDGVPDGWELYVMAGPKVKGKFHFAFPYGDGMYSDFGPFVAKAGESSATDNKGTGTGADKIGDGDGLSELQEFAGTDSCAYYAGKNQISGEKEGGSSGVRYAYSTTIVRPESDKWWLNKFFPTDPWNEDTDGDGLKDGNEIKNSGDYLAARFLYGKNKDLVDTGKTCIPGGGLNPCAIDTDMDGLPDAWEAQFAGQVVYEGDDRQMAKGIPVDKLPALGLDNGSATESKESADIPLQGLCDGMDGTVKDAFNSPREKTYDGATAIDYVVKLDGVLQVVDRDYDRDGLENWQEYLTGAMRCWRYDDPITGWGIIPDAAYYDPVKGSFDIGRALAYTGIATEDEFWYRTLFDRESKWYNPHLVTGTSTAREYFSRVTNAWDQAFSDAGTYYLFPDRVNGVMLNTEWGVNHYSEKTAPHKYISTSPILADTDKDGMDDYYELFHGMNPLLGLPDVTVASDGPCDIVFDAWYKEGAGSPVHALDNVWMKDADGNPTGNPLSANPAYDFVAHPWLNGLVTADPDGDDIRNQDEAIMPMNAPSTTWHHTDPTPLWMTDSTYTNSLVYRFFRLPIGKCPLIPMPETITFDGKTFPLYDRDGFMRIPDIGTVLAAFTPDYWKLSALNTMNWIYSFEENEGYDSDHDGTSDEEELQGKFRNKTDPQDADSPRRRQAMYFGGPSDPSALQTMPFVKEAHPRTGLRYPDDMSFLQYTVDCWVKPESTADATVLERTSFVDPTHCADERYVRRNFTIAIRNGKWYTAFDANGTMDGTVVEVQGKTDAKAGEWAYVAATYDANRLTLYVNGSEDGYVLSSLKPEYGSSAVAVYPPDGYTSSTNGTVEGDIEASRGEPHHYWFDCEYQLHAFLVGASFASVNEGNPARSPLNVTNARGWEGFYKSFFQGYVDEIRVWDGAQTAEDIAANFETRRRITRDDAIENRSAFFKQWTTGERRYEKDGNGKDRSVIPELRFHWSFDSIPGAENADAVAQAPHGFLDGPKAPWSSPEGYEVPWWAGVVGAYGSVYAGACNWVPWIPNTVAHLPRFDLTTLDSAYWSENYAGDTAGSYLFARTAEPVSKWTQMVRNMTTRTSEFRTTGRRFWLTHNTGTGSNEVSTLSAQFDFTGRHLNQTGDDLLPLGGAFARYVDEMWDGQGASSMWEQTGVDADNDGLPDWWQEYAEQNLREGVPEGEDITWNTMVWYEVGGVKIRITAGEAYQRDLAKGAYVDANGEVRLGPTAYAQTAKSDGLIPDWWKELKKIDGEAPLHDLDNDGLNNYVEYVASELLPFRLNLDPRMARSDTKTLDYFRKVGKLYLGEMLTDHDQMEDHWERSLGNPSIANAAIWDALKDGEKDGWTNFAENRYNGYTMGILAQLVSHAMGDNEVLDAPIPSIKMKVRYNGDRSLASEKSDDDKKDGGKAALVVRAYSKDAQTGAYAMMPSAVWSVTPGETVDKEVYLGCWEDRVVRGTMAPGNIDIDSVDIKFAQILQSDLYSWTDEGGTHVSGTYKEFLAALEKDPSIIQNVQRGHSATGEQLWKSFTDYLNPYGAAAVRAVVVARDSLTQKGVIAVYGERVGTIDLTTGDFEFDLGAMTRLNGLDGTYDSDPRDKWGFKEGIYKLVYQAKVPSTQLREVDFSLAKADSGFIRGGLNSIEAFYDCVTVNGTWDPGEPYGVLNDVDIGWAGRNIELELTDMSAVTPRVKLWGASGKENGGGGGQTTGEAQAGASAADSDRGTRVGVETFSDVSNRFEIATAPAPKSRVRVVRYKVDKFPVYQVGVNAGVVLEKDFEQTSRDFLHEGDFLADGDLDIDWANLYTDVVAWSGVQGAACEVTNVTYLIVYNWDESFYLTDDDTNSQVKANATLVTRRFEVTRTVPTPCPERAVYNLSQPTFAWKIENEDKWASWFGTTYTAFKVRVKDLNGDLVYDSGIRRLPARDADGVYSWTAPLYVGEKVPGTGVLFENHGNYTWEVAVYNAKFKTDTLYEMARNDSTGERVFSAPTTFKMDVTSLDASSCALATRVCYAGPATWLEGRIRLQAFASPDFTGDPVAELTLGDVSAEALSPSVKTANAKLIGLPEGNYFLRAYIDTNGNGVHDEWESWGYLNERDLASKSGIFNPVAAAATLNPSEANVRLLLIEDCDTDGDWFPDVWEAEQNEGVFDPEVVKPVTGDAELIGVNTNLDANLTKEMQGLGILASANGFSLLTGVNPARVRTTVAANGTSRFSVDNKVDSVTISSLDFDADGNVVIRIDAKTSVGAVDPVATAIYDLDLSKTVTCRIYRKTNLASPGWGDPVAEETVTVGAGPVTIPVEGEKAAQAFYRAEIVEK